VDQENATGLEPNNQILAPSTDLGDALPLELGGHGERLLGHDEPPVEDLHTVQPATLEHRGDPGAHGLDLGQLGHRANLAAAGCDASLVGARLRRSG
jgi:hypothetical protein